MWLSLWIVLRFCDKAEGGAHLATDLLDAACNASKHAFVGGTVVAVYFRYVSAVCHFVGVGGGVEATVCSPWIGAANQSAKIQKAIYVCGILSEH